MGASLSICTRLQPKLMGLVELDLSGSSHGRGESRWAAVPPRRGSEQIRCSPHPLALLLALLPQLSPKKRRGLTAIKTSPLCAQTEMESFDVVILGAGM